MLTQNMGNVFASMIKKYSASSKAAACCGAEKGGPGNYQWRSLFDLLIRI